VGRPGRKSKAESDAPGKAKAQGRRGRRPKGSDAAPEPGAQSKDAAESKVAAGKPRLVALESIAEALADQDDDDEWHLDSDASGGSDVLWDVPFDAFVADVVETLPMDLSATVVAVAEELAEIERLLALGGPPPRSAPLLLLSLPLAASIAVCSEAWSAPAPTSPDTACPACFRARAFEHSRALVHPGVRARARVERVAAVAADGTRMPHSSAGCPQRTRLRLR
jgi:hypothetical protein